MGNKYLETKNDTLESSVLGVWKTAIEEGEAIRDAAQMTKKEPNLDEGQVIFDDHDTDDDDFKALTKKLRLKVKTKGDETTVSGSDANISKMLKTMRMKKDTDGHAVLEEVDLDEKHDTHVDPKDRDELDGSKNATGKGGAETAKKMKRAQEPAPGQMAEASGDKEAYKKFFDAALKKFKVSSPAELKGDDKKKFFDYIDKNWDADNEKAEGAMSQVREFKIQSMKAALAKVWGMEEGKNPFAEGELPPALKKAIDAKKKDKEEEDEEVEKNGKTATGKKAAVIDVKPKIKD